MEEVDIKSLLRHILSKMHIILLLVVLTVGAGEFYTICLQTPKYRSTTQVVLINDNTGSQLTVNDVQISNNLVTTYAEIVKSSNVLQQSIDNLHLDMDVNTLRKKLSVTTTTNTQLITINVSDENPEQAQKIAAEIAETFKKEVKSIYKIDNVQVVDQASYPEKPYNVNVLRQTIYYLIAGIALGLGTAIAMYYLDTTVKSQDEVENKLGIAVIGTIPDMEN